MSVVESILPEGPGSFGFATLATLNNNVAAANAAFASPVVSATDALTAHAGGTQAAGLALPSRVNRATVVATAADSFVLPAAVPGVVVYLINSAAKACQVYGAGTDTINDVATATGVSQMGNSIEIYVCPTAGPAGKWYVALGTGFTGSLQTFSFAATMTADTNNTQAGAIANAQMTAMTNRFSTVAAQGNGGALPAAVAGLEITVINRGAFAMQVYGTGTDTINGIATATGVSLGVNTSAVFVCNVAGNWEVPLNSLASSSPVLLSVNGAIPPHVAHTYVITKAGVLADTLAAPTPGTDDGLEITITSDTAFAHTLTATGLLQTGSASVNVATFAAFAGAGLTLMAYNGKWKVLASVGITFS